jgi:phage/plasmid-like protein (TIGR03299 family)
VSNETAQWLNTMTLQGLADLFGKAWHYDPELSALAAGGTNTFPGPVPIERLEDLISWRFIKVPLKDIPVSAITSDGVTVGKAWTDRFVGLAASDTMEILSVVSSSFVPHQFNELKDMVVDLVGDEQAQDKGLTIRSAGLLENRGTFWVQVILPSDDANYAATGFNVIPYLTLTSSVMGKTTSISFGGCAVVCDNTLALHESMKIPRVKIRHTKNSAARLENIAETLGIFDMVGENFRRMTTELADTRMSDGMVQKFISLRYPSDDKNDSFYVQSKRAAEVSAFMSMYTEDPRCAQWTGTALGVFQTCSTMDQHWPGLSGQRGRKPTTGKAYQGALNMVQGKSGDADTLDQINAVLKASKAKQLSFI